jgi:hypothetical protein
MATAAPACATGEEGRMIHALDENHSRTGLLLEVAFEAQVRVARSQHLRIYTAVGIVAGDATLLHCLVFEHEWPSLSRMAFEARFIHGGQRRPSAPHR